MTPRNRARQEEPPPDAALVVRTTSEDETRRLAEMLGRHLEVGTLIGLVGPLGAGKTRFVQGLARGLGVADEAIVASPTYTYVNEYPGRIPLYHMDLYRVSSLEDLEDLGYRDYYYGDGVCAVEWFDRVPEAIPDSYLEVRISVVPGGREIRFRPVGGHAATAVAALAADWYAGGRPESAETESDR